MRRHLPRNAALLLSVSGLLVASLLGAPAAPAAPRTQPVPAPPPGWELVTGPSPAAAGTRALAAAEAETTVTIKSVKTGLFTSTEVTYPAPYTGLLRSRAGSASGSWEEFHLRWHERSQSYGLVSAATGRYVTVENGWTGADQGMLRARGTSFGGWEKFYLFYNSDTGRYGLRAAVNDRFVAVEANYTGSRANALRARSSGITGSWEQFLID